MSVELVDRTGKCALVTVDVRVTIRVGREPFAPHRDGDRLGEGEALIDGRIEVVQPPSRGSRSTDATMERRSSWT